MHVRRLGGSFLSHPYWRLRFTLTSQSEVERLRNCAVPYVEIDDELGCGPIEEGPVEPLQNSYLVDRIGENLVPAKQRRKGRHNFATPTKRAEYVRSVTRAKLVVRELFSATALGGGVPLTEAAKLVEGLDNMFEQGETMLVHVVRMKNADEYTYMHSVAVCVLMLKLARQLGMPPDAVRECGFAGLLHDVGKMRIPADVLHKRGTLSDAEFEVIKTHPQEGFDALQGVEALPAAALEVVLLHHEKIDGSGYPRGLVGEKIPLIARMGAICDVYDALTSDRAYKAAWEPSKAIDYMLTSEGHFDAELVRAFAQCVELGELCQTELLP